MKKQKILALSAGRSDYDRYYPIIKKLNNTKNIDFYLFLTKSHSDPVFGKTYRFIDKKFKILKNSFSSLKHSDFVSSFSKDLIYLNKKIKKLQPDKILVLGDRYEMLMGPIVAMPYNIPVIHFYGGAVTLGAFDELIRHAITKMSHIHFTLLPKYKKRVLQLGEEKWRVNSTGMHELSLLKKSNINKIKLNKHFGFDFQKPYILLTFHPVTLDLKNIDIQMNELLRAIKLSKMNTVITYPNYDPKHKKIINFIEKNFKNKNKFLLVKNLGKNYFSNILKYSTLVLGNSSSGIVEAATFKVPAVNIGIRQEGKVKPINVIDTNYNYNKIYKAILIAKSEKFRKKISRMTNPYENQISLKKLVSLITKLKVNKKLLIKKFIDIK